MAAVVGILAGSISYRNFSLTTTGGCLLTALVFGHYGHIGKISIVPKSSTLKMLRELGLMLFLIGAGVSGGAKFIEYFEPVYFLYGAIITILPMIIGFIIVSVIAVIFLSIGISCRKSREAVGFFTFVKPPIVEDVKHYNNAVSILWFVVAVWLKLLESLSYFYSKILPYGFL